MTVLTERGGHHINNEAVKIFAVENRFEGRAPDFALDQYFWLAFKVFFHCCTFKLEM